MDMDDFIKNEDKRIFKTERREMLLKVEFLKVWIQEKTFKIHWNIKDIRTLKKLLYESFIKQWNWFGKIDKVIKIDFGHYKRFYVEMQVVGRHLRAILSAKHWFWLVNH